jgi:hypothetical protein
LDLRRRQLKLRDLPNSVRLDLLAGDADDLAGDADDLAGDADDLAGVPDFA